MKRTHPLWKRVRFGRRGRIDAVITAVILIAVAVCAGALVYTGKMPGFGSGPETAAPPGVAPTGAIAGGSPGAPPAAAVKPLPTPEMNSLIAHGYFEPFLPYGTDVRNEDLTSWQSLKVDMTDADLPLSRPFPNLRVIILSQSHESDRGLQSLAQWIPQLERLDLKETRVTDRVVQTISVMKGLKNLKLTGDAITDQGLATIADSFPDLEVLWTQRTRTTDAGLELLHSLPRLHFVYAADALVTQSAADDLMRSVPGCKVQID